MKLDILLIVGLFLIGVLLGLAVAGWAFRSVLRAVGIEDIRYCELKTVTCETNWWEIVWADQAKPAAKGRHNPDMNAKKRNACGKTPAAAGARPEKLPFGACGKTDAK